MAEVRDPQARRQSQPRRRPRGEAHRPPPEDRTRSPERKPDRQRESKAERLLPDVRVIGWAFVLLLLAGYFVWIIAEMGSHSVSGAGPMIAVFGAAFAGLAAAGIALASGRRRDD
jgi:hypothetical protein